MAPRPERAGGGARLDRPATRVPCSPWSADGNFHQSQFNLAVQGERQPGSSFKPFVLAAALQEGISPQTTFKSGPVSIFLGNKYWVVHNYEGESLGVIDLTKALAASDNTVFAQLTKVVGPSHVVHAAHELGITRPLQSYFAIGLGAEPVSPLEMARAYASFANGGSRIDGSLFGNEPRAVTRIDSATGGVLYRNSPVRRRVLSDAEDAIVTQLLAGVIANGTGTAAAIPGRAVAGKTGTTENYGDAWFVGYTPHLVTAVWVGYPNTLKPMLTEFHGKPVVGGTFPALIWKTFTEAALASCSSPPSRSRPPRSSPARPSGSPTATDRPSSTTGSCRDTQLVVYFDGRGPAKTRGLQAERGRRPERRRAHARRGPDAARGAAADPGDDLPAGGAGPAGRRGGAPVPVRGHAHDVRQGDARARQAAARARAARRRTHPARRPGAAREAQAPGGRTAQRRHRRRRCSPRSRRPASPPRPA